MLKALTDFYSHKNQLKIGNLIALKWFSRASIRFAAWKKIYFMINAYWSFTLLISIINLFEFI